MYVLHTTPDSAGFVIHVVLEELGVPYKVALLDREAGEADTPAYRALQPLGLVPALETPDGPIFETGAILLWLADRHGGLAPAPDSPERGAFLKWFFLVNNGLHATAMQLFYPERYVGDASAIPGALGKSGPRFHGFARLLDGMAAGTPSWCSLTGPSILGYYISMLVRWAQFYEPGNPGRLTLSDYPALERLGAALEARPAALRVAEAEGLGPMFFTRPAI
jgi:glutathione S-transferase